MAVTLAACGGSDSSTTADTTTISALTSENNELKVELSDANGQVTTLTGQVTALTTENGTLTAQLTAANGQVTTLTGQVTALTTENGELKVDLATATGQVTALTTENGQLKIDLTSANGQVTTLTGQLSSLTTANGNLTAQLNAVNTEAAYANETAAFEGGVASRNVEVANLNNQITALQGQVSTLNSNIGQLQTQLTAINNTDYVSESAAFTAGAGSRDVEVANLGHQITTLQNTVSNLNTTITGLQAQITAIDTEAAYATETAAYAAGVASRSAEVASLTQQVANLTQQVQTLNAQLTTINNTDYATEQAAFDGGVASLGTNIANLNSQITTLTGQVQSLTTQLNTINNTVHATEQDAYDAGVASLDAQMATLAAFQDVAARTLSADNQVITLSNTTTGNQVEVAGETAGADTTFATVNANGRTSIVFDFADADDTVVLSANSDLTGVTSIEVQDGTVDFRNIDPADLAGINISAGSGVMMTSAQLLVLGVVTTRTGANDFDLFVFVSPNSDVAALTQKLASIVAAGGNATFRVDDGDLTPAQVTALQDAGVTVTNLFGDGPVVPINATPTITGAETTAIVKTPNTDVALTANAVVADADIGAGSWNGGSITISTEAGKFFGTDNASGSGLTYAQGAGAYNFSVVGSSLFAAPTGSGATLAIGTVANNGATTLSGDDGAFTGFTITLNANATTAIVNELLKDIQVEDIVIDNGTKAANDEGRVTVTVSDGVASASFTRLVDSDGATALANLNDQGEISVAAGTAGTLNIDNNVTLTAGGIDVGSAVLRLTGVTGDQIDLTNTVGGTTYSSVSNGVGFNLIATTGGTPTIIGTIAGDGTNNVHVEFNSSATTTHIQNLLQGATLTTTSALGGHNVAISLTDDDYVSISETVEISLVGDFTNATANGVTTNTGNAAGNALAFATIAAATPAAPVVLTGNTYVSINGNLAATDIASLKASGALVVANAAVVRLVATGNSNVSAVENLTALGTSVSLFSVSAGSTVSMDVDQALALGPVNVAGGVAILDLQNNLAADLSSITVGGGQTFTAALVTTGAANDVTFTGDLNGADVTVSGGGDFRASAAVLNGENVTVNNGGALIVTDPQNLAGVNLSTHGTAPTVLFTGNVAIAANANTNLGNASLTVSQNSTLTIDADAVSGKTINATNAATFADTGSSVVVTGLKATTNLANISAGTNGGQNGASAGTLTTTVSDDLTLTTANLGSFVVTVAEGATLTGPASVLTAETVGGAGNVVVTALEATAGANLAGLTATGGVEARVTGTDATETASIATTTANVGGGAPVAQVDTITLSEVFTIGDIITLTGVAAGDITYTVQAGDIGANDAATRSAVATALATEINQVAYNAVVTAAAVGETVTLTADVAGTPFTATTNAAHSVAADDLTAYNLGTAAVVVGAGSVVTVTAAQANGATITGESTTNEAAGSEVDQVGGSVLITGLGATAVNLTGVTAGADADGNGTDAAGTVTVRTAAGNNTTVLAATTNLGTAILDINDDNITLTAAQATGRAIIDSDSGNTDSVTINVASAAGNENFSGIAASVTAVTLTTTGSVNLSSMTLGTEVDSVVVTNGNLNVVEASTVTMTATQAGAMNATNGGNAVVTINGAANNALNGVAQANDTVSIVVNAVADAAGGVTYTASAGNDTLNGTQLGDTITGGDGNDIINGGSGDDQLNGGNGADTLRGGAGNDTLDGQGGMDIYVFESTAALNGDDTISYTQSDDRLDFSGFLSGGSVHNNTVVVDATSGDDVLLDGKVVLIEAAGIASVDGANEIAALIQGFGDALELSSGAKGIVISGQAGGAAVMNIFFVDDTVGANVGTIETDDVTLVAQSAGNIDLDSLANANFIF